MIGPTTDQLCVPSFLGVFLVQKEIVVTLCRCLSSRAKTGEKKNKCVLHLNAHKKLNLFEPELATDF